MFSEDEDSGQSTANSSNKGRLFGVKARFEQMYSKNELVKAPCFKKLRVDQDKFKQTTYFAYDSISVFETIGKGKLF